MERFVVVRGIPFIPSSTGTVISRSTSSAACPGHWVMISTMGGERSGYASIGRRSKAHHPAPISTSAMSTTRKRWRNDAAAIRLAATRRSLILHELNEDPAIDHNLVAGVETRGDIILVPDTMTQSHVLPREAAIGLGQIDERQILIVAQNRRYRDQQSGAFPAALDQHAHIHLLLQVLTRIFHDHTHRHRTAV